MAAASKRKKTNLVNDKNWALYAAAGAASAFACQAAEAEIIYVNVNQALDASGTASTQSASAAFGVGAASSASITFGHLGVGTGTSAVGAAFFGVGNGSFAGFSAFGYPYANNLAAGQNVSTMNFLAGTGTMAFTGGFGNSQFLGAGIGYLGFTFDGGSGSQYGWARVDMSGAPLNAFTIIDYAFGDVGEAIAAGQMESIVVVPEPGTMGLLAAGAAGLLALRKRRKEIRAA